VNIAKSKGSFYLVTDELNICSVHEYTGFERTGFRHINQLIDALLYSRSVMVSAFKITAVSNDFKIICEIPDMLNGPNQSNESLNKLKDSIPEYFI